MSNTKTRQRWEARRRMYKHLVKAWRKRFRREHWCPECADPRPAHPPLSRDPEENR